MYKRNSPDKLFIKKIHTYLQ